MDNFFKNEDGMPFLQRAAMLALQALY